jgi:hypothetical protein
MGTFLVSTSLASEYSGNRYEAGYELGPGKVIAGIMKRIDRKAVITNVDI